MISKELLSEVLHDSVIAFSIKGNTLFYQCTDYFDDCINIYELGNMCKEWAYTNHGAVINIFQKTRYNPYTAKLEGKVFQSDTEPEAIFKATSYIMEQLKQKD